MFRPTLVTAAFLLLLVSAAGLVQTAAAQNPKDFTLANQLMQFGNYRDAADILRQLHRENPKSYPVFNRLVRCLTELKEYKEAIKLTKNQLQGRFGDVNMSVSLGDLYHLEGDSTAGLKQWSNTLTANRLNQQAWREVGDAMVRRRFYEQAEKVYVDARREFDAPSLFMNELSNLYMQWGKYDRAAREWIQLVEADPSRSSLLQRQVFRAEDDDLIDAFILELEEAGRLKQPGSKNYYTFRDLLIRMYTEKKMFKRALALARQLEETSVEAGATPVLALGARLAQVREFELSEEAFLYYEANQASHIYKLSLEERARLYKNWGDALLRSESGTMMEAQEKYKRSLSVLEKWKSKYGEGSLPVDLAILFIQLTIDHLKDPAMAAGLLENIRKAPSKAGKEGELLFLEGRIQLMNGDFSRARLFFNRALKTEPVSELAEKSRYYLGFTDFYAGEFEFSAIQLRALERQSVSLYANNAVKLRTWMQDGSGSDSLKPELKALASILFLIEKGEMVPALTGIAALLKNYPEHPVAVPALQSAAELLAQFDPRWSSALLLKQAEIFRGQPGAERLFWLTARFTELAEIRAKLPETAVPASGTFKLLADSPFVQAIPVYSNRSPRELVQLYENVLMNWPNGFFATQARERILQLEKELTL